MLTVKPIIFDYVVFNKVLVCTLPQLGRFTDCKEACLRQTPPPTPSGKQLSKGNEDAKKKGKRCKSI